MRLFYSGLFVIVIATAACGDSTSGNEDTTAENSIESRWAAIVEIATNPNPLQDADIDEFKGYLTFPFSTRISDDADAGFEEEIVTEQEFDQRMNSPEVRSVIINSMILISPFDIAPGDLKDPEIRISGNSATRTVTIQVPAMPDLDLGSHVSHWVRTGGEWYVQGVDFFIDEPTF